MSTEVILKSGQTMPVNEPIIVNNGKSQVLLINQDWWTGNAQFQYTVNDEMWWSTLNHVNSTVKFKKMIMQEDGNLVMYSDFGGQEGIIWASDTDNNPGAYLRVNNENTTLEIVLNEGNSVNVIWVSRTANDIAGILPLEGKMYGTTPFGSPGVGRLTLNVGGDTNQSLNLSLYDATNKEVWKKNMGSFSVFDMPAGGSITGATLKHLGQFDPVITSDYFEQPKPLHGKSLPSKSLMDDRDYTQHIVNASLKVDWSKPEVTLINPEGKTVWSSALNEQVGIITSDIDSEKKKAKEKYDATIRHMNTVQATEVDKLAQQFLIDNDATQSTNRKTAETELN